jgi:hypothetical protein
MKGQGPSQPRQPNAVWGLLAVAYVVPGAVRRAAEAADRACGGVARCGQQAHALGGMVVAAVLLTGGWAAWAAPVLGRDPPPDMRAAFVLVRCGALLVSATPPTVALPLLGELHLVGLAALCIGSAHAAGRWIVRTDGSAAQQAARLVYWLSAWLGVLLLGARAATDSADPALEAVGAGLMYAAPLAMRVLLE